jgi:peptidoglycan/xylan/chitin deacetylase (PgdA/CDA1 family)
MTASGPYRTHAMGGLAAVVLTLALLATATTVALASGSALASRRSVRQSVAARARASSRAAGRRLFRIVGCVSHTGVAYRGGPDRREVAFGFDDGPAPDTIEFVHMLERNDARATFFMIGRQVTAEYRPLLLRELRDGDVLGDHTFTHPDLDDSPDVSGQLSETISAIRGLTGYTPCVFRPPYGDYDASVLRTASSLHLATVLWNVDPSDWTQPGTAAIEQRVLAQVRPGSIVISHDGGGSRSQTLAAYPSIIASLRARGYRIVTIAQLLGFRPVYVPCVKLCDGIGIPRRALPRNAILRHAPAP